MTAESQPTRHVDNHVFCMRLWGPKAAVVFVIGALNRAGCMRGRVGCRLQDRNH